METDNKQQPSAAIALLTATLSNVEEVLVKAEQTVQLLQQNLAQVNAQRTGYTYQKNMLNELITRIQQAEQLAQKKTQEVIK